VTAIREIETGPDLRVWADLKSRITPDDPVSAEQIEVTTTTDRLLLLAELRGRAVGCGIADRSSIPGRFFVAPRVLPESRRRGVGTQLLHALGAHAGRLGFDRLAAHVDARDEGSVAFATRFGFEEVDRQVEFIRIIGDEPAEAPPPGIELVSIARRPELLGEAYEAVGRAGYRELPLHARVEYTRDEWLREEATRPEGSLVALEQGIVVGYAGMLVHANGPAAAEHGLLVVRPDRRRRGLGTALRRAQLAWASANGVHELVDWTQGDNTVVRRFNERLGYRHGAVNLRVEGPRP